MNSRRQFIPRPQDRNAERPARTGEAQSEGPSFPEPDDLSFIARDSIVDVLVEYMLMVKITRSHHKFKDAFQ